MLLGVEVGLLFFDGVLPRFLFQVLALCSRNCSEKILLVSGHPFFGFVLPFLVFRRRFCLLRDTAQVVTGHTPHAPFWSVSFSLFLSPPRLLSPVLAVRPFWRFVGGPFLGPVRFGVFVGFSRYFGGLSEALFLDARRPGCSGRFFLLFLFPPSVLFAAFSHQL